MELEFHDLFIYLFLYLFLFLFFLSLIVHNSILNQVIFSLKLDFNKIEFQNKGMNLYSFKTGAYCQIFFKIGVKG